MGSFKFQLQTGIKGRFTLTSGTAMGTLSQVVTGGLLSNLMRVNQTQLTKAIKFKFQVCRFWPVLKFDTR